MNPDHIHTPHDGRGPRDAFVNGKQVTGVVYADTLNGFVRCVDSPARLNKDRTDVLTHTIKGEVVVKPAELKNG